MKSASSTKKGNKSKTTSAMPLLAKAPSDVDRGRSIRKEKQASTTGSLEAKNTAQQSARATMKSANCQRTDLAIIGSGPAALTAAVYARRAGISVRVYERANIGGTLNEIAELENYPGFEGPGAGLAQKMREQAERYGAKISYGECTEIRRPAQGCELLVDEEWVTARAVLVATGAAPRHLDLPENGEAPRLSYCALCDGSLAKDKHVAMIGGANAAAQEALYLSDLAQDVTIITHSKLKADQYLQDLLHHAENIEVREDIEPTLGLLQEFDHVFVAIGKRPSSECLQALAEEIISDRSLLDEKGYIVTLDESDFPHQTVVPGVFAAGDVRHGAVQQAVTAAGEGAAAAIEIAKWLKTQQE